MPLEDKINTDLKSAMLAKDEARVRSLRAIKSAILLAKTSGTGSSVSAEEELKLLQKLVKQRKESAEIYHQQNRSDLATTEEEEIKVIEQYLPKMMSEDELKAELKKIMESIGASSAADFGKVMGAASKQLAGKTDNKMIAALAKQMLQ
jgi:hypothetical protein